jgi:hypothetical protein
VALTVGDLTEGPDGYRVLIRRHGAGVKLDRSKFGAKGLR